MINCPDNCDDGQHDEFSCNRNCYCGGCTTKYECERCNGRGMVCDCGRALDDDGCEDCDDDEEIIIRQKPAIAAVQDLQEKLAASEKRAEAWKKAWEVKNEQSVLLGYERINQARDVGKVAMKLLIAASELDKEAGTMTAAHSLQCLDRKRSYATILKQKLYFEAKRTWNLHSMYDLVGQERWDALIAKAKESKRVEDRIGELVHELTAAEEAGR